MIGSLILGCILVVMGLCSVIIGLCVAVVATLDWLARERKKSVSMAISEGEIKILEIVGALFKELLGAPGGPLFVMGIVLGFCGVALLVYRPF
jgi:energy-converting hydrogenase Eha subunit A